MVRAYNKLVRDNIPIIIDGGNEKAVTRVLNGNEYRQSLEKKLNEEVGEYLSSGSVEELADILEVVYALASEDGCSAEELEQLRLKKRESHGSFEKRILLIAVESSGD